jgi:hypothetical protein
MRNCLISALLLGCCVWAAAQAGDANKSPTQEKSQGPAPQELGAVVGFHYDPPPGWTALATKPPSQPANAAAPDAEPRKGTACLQVSLTAEHTGEHGAPASVIVVAGLPFACYGEMMSASDLAAWGASVSDELKQTFDITGPVTGSYALGNHPFWVERARGNPKGHPEVAYTVEIACTLLKKGAVCWMATAADADSLKAFEQAPVDLEGDPPTALVPDSAFAKAAP